MTTLARRLLFFSPHHHHPHGTVGSNPGTGGQSGDVGGNWKRPLLILKQLFRKAIEPQPYSGHVTDRVGGVLKQPESISFAIIKVMTTMAFGIYLGANISKHGAAFLEENDIFVPDDDDDGD